MVLLPMRNTSLLITALLVFFFVDDPRALAQSNGAGSGKIVCWKDKTGKTVGCGDSVPPEYEDNASKTLDKQGITLKKTDAMLTPEQMKAAQEDLDRKQVEQRKAEDQRRRDKALLDTFTTPQEIDLKRDRDLQLAQSNLELLQSNMKNADAGLIQAQARVDNYNKSNKPVPDAVQGELDRATAEKTKTDQQVAAKKQEIVDINQKYSDLKQRFILLTGGSAAAKK
jgi:hypothetical protein